MESLPASAWTWYTPHTTEDEAQVETRYIHVPFLNRAVDIRAGAVASLPFAVVSKGGEDMDTSDDWQNKVGFLPDPGSLFYLVESALTLLGRAYLFRSRNTKKTLGLQYLLPTTVQPVIKEGFDSEGLAGFIRQIGGEKRQFEPEDIVYFWRLDPFKEIGPGNNAPAVAALAAAGVLFNVDQFASSFFERGAIKVTLLTVKGPIQKEERERLKTWWGRTFGGMGRAWQTDIVQGDTITPVVVGEGIKELSDSQLTKEKREDIATALGIPMTKLWSTEAGGLGGGGVVQQDDLTFYQNTIIPEAEFIARVLNRQVFEPAGLRFEFRPETLDIFQEDETQRAQSFKTYVDAGIKRSVAAQMVGLELPSGVEFEDLDPDEPEPQAPGEGQPNPFLANQQQMPPAVVAQQERMRQAAQQVEAEKALMFADLRKWRTKAKKRGACDFESDYIPEPLAEAVGKALAEHGADVAFSFLKASSLPEMEAKMAALVKKILVKYLAPAAVAIEAGQAFDIGPLSEELRAALEPQIVAIATEQALRVAAEVGVEFDPAMVNDEAAAWARGYTFDLVKGLVETTRKVVSGAVESYMQTPGMTRGQLESLLSAAFGEYRASTIAVTETTRAYAQAMNQYQKEIMEGAGIEMERVVVTNRDELVCPVCGPLDGQPEEVWADEFPDGPPFHTGCRCGLILQYKKKGRR